MGLFSQIKELFESFFNSSSPEARQKQEVKKIENELRIFQPAIYKSRQVLPNFAEVFRILHEHSVPLAKLFSETIDSVDSKQKDKYMEILIQTGFSDKSKEILESLKYENRKQEFLSNFSPTKIHESQRKNMDFLVKEMANSSFSQIEMILQNLEVFVDVCKFPYASLLREFNPDYTLGAKVENQFPPLQIEVMEQYLLDFYYLTAHFKINAALGRAILALAFSRSPETMSENDQNQLLAHVRKISTVLSKVLTPTNLKNLIRVIKNDPAYEPKIAMNQPSIVMKYAEKIKASFEQDSQRIDVEVQDEHIKKETAELFNNVELDAVNGYNQDNSNIFFRSGAGSFLWVTPLQILKNFVTRYYAYKVNTFLNDLVVEGFFNNPQYKTEFSSIVFTCAEIDKRITEFEESFEKNGKNNIALMTGYLHDSHTDQNFMKSLHSMINSVNLEAKSLIQRETVHLFQLHKKLTELLSDAKRTSPEHIENLRMLCSSPRNKDKYEFLDTTFSKWNIFLDIMKNYAIISGVRDE